MIPYDPHDWRTHLWDIRGSMVREILFRVLTCVVWSGVVCVVQFAIKPYGYSLSISELGHSLIGVALGLLLVFRTNASYDRFWEGRKQWGAIVNETRNLARGASVYLAADPRLITRLVEWTIIFTWAVMHRLRDGKGLGPTPPRLPADEVAAVEGARHVPLAIACRMTGTLEEAGQRGLISDYVKLSLDQNVQLLIDYMGACERIHLTPLPFAYMVHLRRMLILYCYTLPFALLERFGWETVAATLVIAYILFGIEEIGVEVEDPFGFDDNDLPLEEICTNIEGNLREVLTRLPAMPDADLPAA